MESGMLPDFRNFCFSQFRLSYRASLVKDGRGAAIIPASTVFHAVFLMGALGLPSLLQCDQTLRTPIGFRWFRKKGPAVSDSTMARSQKTMKIDTLRTILHDAYLLSRNFGASKCPLRCGKLRIGIIDGSKFGRFEASCLEIVGPVSLMVDLEHIPKHGKELPSSYTLLRRLKDDFGRGFVDLMMGDGIYLNAPFFNLCLQELGSDVLVKTDDTSRNIIQDAIGLFRCDQLSNIAKTKGADAQRMLSYEVMMSSGFTMEGVDSDLSVAWVREINIRTGEYQEFWVVTSASQLTPEEARELGHWRWDVENNGFKALNQTVHTKRIYSHDDTASEAILLILFCVFNLLELYLLLYATRLTDYPGMKKTRKFTILILRCIMIALAFLEYG